MSKNGYVYILSNESMPGIVKIGKSKHGGRHRAEQLYNTGVPTPFYLEFEIYCEDAGYIESASHDALDKSRVSEAREFFRCSVTDAIAAVSGEFLCLHDLSVVSSDFDVTYSLEVLAHQSGYDCKLGGLDLAMALQYINSDAIYAALHKYEIECRRRKEEMIKSLECIEVE